MKRKITFLIAALFALTLITQPMKVVGQTWNYTKVYTLDGTQTYSGETSYTSGHSITNNSKNWNVMGNLTLSPSWGIGGKSTSNVDRPIYSTDAISDNVSRITIYHGSKQTKLTVNSMTVTIHNSASDASTGADPIISFSPSFVASDSIVINKSDATSWAGKYYRIVYNIKTDDTNNNYKFYFTKAIFYKNSTSDPIITANDITIKASATSGTINYTVSYPVDGGKISAVKTTDAYSMITNITVTNEDSAESTIVLTTNTNTTGSEKTAVVTLTYTYGTKATKTKAVTITQQPYYTVTIDDDITYGSVESDKYSCDDGETVTLTPSPSDGYTLGSYTITKNGGGEVEYEGNQFIMPKDNVTVSATFVPKHTLSYSTSNGTISVNGASGSTSGSIEIGQGATATIVATPAAGYAFSTWAVTGTGSSVTVATSASTTFTMGSVDTELTASFVPALAIDFESAMSSYTDWNYTNITSQNTHGSVTAHSGSYFGTTGANTSASLVTKTTIKTPNSITFYVTKQTTNDKKANWKVQVSENGSSWTQVGEAQDAISMDVGTWVEVTRDLSDYTNVYVRVLYTNTDSGTAVRAIDDLTLVYTPAPKHELSVSSVDHITIKASSESKDIAEGDNASISEGSAVTLSCTSHDNGYRFDDWHVYKYGDESTTIAVTSNSFTMPAYDVIVSAITVQTYTLTYDINGNTIETIIDKDDEVDPLPIPGEEETVLQSATIPSGYLFVGWTDNLANTTDEDLVTSYTANSDAIIHAIFKKSNTLTLTGNDFATSYPTTEADYNIGGVKFGVLQVMKSGAIQFKSGVGYIYNKDAFVGLTSIVATRTTTYACTLTGGDSSNPSSGTEISASTSSYVDTYTISGNYQYILLKNGTGNAVKYSSIVFNFTGDETRYTRVFTDNTPATEDITITGPTIISPNSILDMGDNELSIGAGGSLIIEDGGQLICNNSVPATVKKKITAPTSASKDRDVYGWYTISSPVHDDGETTIAVGNVVNLVSNADPAFKYDMFAYSEADQKWINRKSGSGASGFDEMNKGQGYIYRNSGEELSFVGKTNTGAIDCPLSKESTGDLAGFNLIGNPYTHSITKGEGKSIDTDDASLTAGFYVLEDDTWVTYNDGDEIKAKQGVLIKATAAAATFQIKDVNYVAPAKSNGDNIKFIVSNGQSQDVAYALFDKGIGLDKINHRSPEVPMLYINQDGQDYAIATMSDDTKAFNLNFKAGKMGKYTLSFDANNHFNYLHLIDLLTSEDIDMLLEKEYSFIATPSDKDNRFIVKLGYNPGNESSGDDIFAYQSGNDIYVTGNGELQIFDVTGRQVMTTTINGMESISIPNQGVYIFRLNEKVQKIVVR